MGVADKAVVQPTSTKFRYFEPWKILVILLGSTIAAAIIIGFLTYFSQYGIRDQKLSYYKGNFKITGLQYNGALSRQTSDQYRDLGNWIEKLMYETFHNSVLRHKYRGSRLIKVSPNTSGVLAQVVLIFFSNTESEVSLHMAVNRILRHRLQIYPGSSHIDLSSSSVTGKCFETFNIDLSAPY
ncbi:transmembrane protease serine 11B-like protein [Ahaetulla prasina]|uniref:transmembrane protease serine 11B-like protein n=1 Tax=Ahaetulla prasina TaxID=499056 RepID=UPI002649DF83|nr:transmembrane protease serine 11B-like protein [Ahaetulla prasina]